MEILSLFSEDWVDLNQKADNILELFESVNKDLLSKGLVNDGYLMGVTEREKIFPTGLITQYLNISLPHSDTKYIEEPFVYIVRLDEPIIVKQMGDSQEMEVKDLFFLGIKNPSEQVGLLSKIMELFMNENFVKEYKKVETSKETIELIKKYL